MGEYEQISILYRNPNAYDVYSKGNRIYSIRGDGENFAISSEKDFMTHFQCKSLQACILLIFDELMRK